jgi:hypothetical protein
LRVILAEAVLAVRNRRGVERSAVESRYLATTTENVALAANNEIYIVGALYQRAQ